VKKLFLIFLTFALPASASDLHVRSEFYGIHDFHINGLELFEASEVPEGLLKPLESQLLKTEIPTDGKATLSRKEISGWLRDTIVDYNRKTLAESGEKLRLYIPETVEIFSRTGQVSKENLRRRISKKALKHCPGCEFEITFFETLPKLKDFEPWGISAPGDRWKGEVSLTLKNQNEEKVTPVRIRWFDSVVTARYQIPSGRKLTKESLQLQRQEVTFAKTPPLTKIDDILGMTTIQTFRKGQILFGSALKKPQVVRYGQIVTVALKDKQFSLSTSAKAKGAGAAGELIPVEILKTKKRVMAEVVDSKLVRMQ